MSEITHVDGSGMLSSTVSRSTALALFATLVACLGFPSASLAAPTVEITSPTAAETWFDGNLHVTGTAGDDLGRAVSVRLVYSRSGETTICNVVATSEWSCDWDTTQVPDDKYTITAYVTDADGQTTQSIDRATHIANDGPKIEVFTRWHNRPGVTSASAAGMSLFVDPARSGSADFVLDARSAHTVIYPTITGMTLTHNPIGTVTYSWDAGMVQRRNQLLTVLDHKGNSVSRALHIEVDGSAPIGGSIEASWDTVENRPVVSFTNGRDMETALNSALHQRRELQLDGSDCTNPGPWSSLPRGVYYPYSDVDATDPDSCYEYRLVMTDRVGNQTIVSSAPVYAGMPSTSAPVVDMPGPEMTSPAPDFTSVAPISSPDVDETITTLAVQAATEFVAPPAPVAKPVATVLAASKFKRAGTSLTTGKLAPAALTLVARTCSTCGTVKVYYAGKLAKTISLRSKKAKRGVRFQLPALKSAGAVKLVTPNRANITSLITTR